MRALAWKEKDGCLDKRKAVEKKTHIGEVTEEQPCKAIWAKLLEYFPAEHALKARLLTQAQIRALGLAFSIPRARQNTCPLDMFCGVKETRHDFPSTMPSHETSNVSFYSLAADLDAAS